MKKRILAIVMALAMVMAFTACGGGAAEDTAADSDLATVQANGTLVVGITDFEPMDYKDADGNWIGFDAELAAAFADSIGVEVAYQEIDWDNKTMELDNGNIDCVWNGMTLTDEVLSAMECSKAYLNNAQIVIVPADKVDAANDAETLKDNGWNFAVEAGSAGAEQADAYGLNKTEVQNQADALMQVAAGTADAAIIDSLMAAAMVGEGTSYDNLTYTVGLNSEGYGVGFRKGSDMAALLNDFIADYTASGDMQKLAEKYGVAASLVE